MRFSAPAGSVSGHTGGVAAVAMAQIDGQPVILSGAGDETVRVRSPSGAALRTIEVGSGMGNRVRPTWPGGGRHQLGFGVC
jgi:hypothetical protein